MRPQVCLLIAGLLFGWPALATEKLSTQHPAAEVDFNRDIRSILSENCYACHGPDGSKRKAKLRLDKQEDAFKPAKSGEFAIVPGDLSKSELIRRITTQDEDDRMPPAKSGKHLTPGQIELLRRWIEQGAKWKNHWAYIKPERPSLPEVRNRKWPRNDIDYFILARLDKENLQPSAEASRETLIRRLSLDLIGLPPTIAEVNLFLKDKRPGAYDRLVERLLASPHYGERWARPWLDQARYADSNGYEADNRRSIWPYRDWVINAFNRDLPFDQFTIEQIAGDLLTNATREQKIATGFNRNTMVNTEGGTDEEEFRVAALVDRVNTTFDVWMGSTLGCAQCHDHKYDPFTQKEYYQALAFLNQTRDKGRVNDPELDLPTPAQQLKRDEVKAKLEPLEKILNTQTPELDAAQRNWETPVREYLAAINANWLTLDPDKFDATNGVTLEKLADKSILSTGPTPDTNVYQVVVQTEATNITAIRLEVLVDARLPQKSSGRSEEGDFVLTDFSVEAQTVDSAKTEPVSFATAYADFSMEKYGVKDAIDDKPKSGWSIAAHEATNRVDHQGVFVTKQPIGFAGGTQLNIRLTQGSDRSQHLLGRFRLSVSTASGEAHRDWGKIPEKVRALLVSPVDMLTEDQKKELAKHYRSIDSNLDKVREQVAEIKKLEPKDVPTTLVMQENETNRTTQILIRGSHLNKGAEVTPGVPAVLHPLPPGEPANRLTFARWLVDPANPLTGRVIMNRIWAQYFGRGLVETSEEFGAQGEAPTHPELLDWLATEFIRQGWSLKAMHRLIVTSATYRQTSAVTPELYQQDPYNRLLAHGPRFRMEAEMLRDNALAVSGLLVRKIGGPSVFPFQPEGV
ncbi:MAG: PSD1 and planctomycete cytochrome C domain-containing protein, partial [Verrucomicrobiota bacterium]